jgi:hypothetical protein
MLDRCLIGIGTVVLLAMAGCQGQNTPQATQAGTITRTGTPATPSQTVERLHALRTHGQYAELGAIIEHTDAADLVDFLLAMDEFMSANDEVQAAIRKFAPTAPAMKWDLSSMENRQGLFSTDVKVIDEETKGSQAWVTIQVADTVPLEIIPLRSIGGRWVYCPESRVGGLPSAIRRLSRAMRRVANSISHDSLTEDEIHTEFRLRISPYLKAIQSIAAAQAATTKPAMASR